MEGLLAFLFTYIINESLPSLCNLRSKAISIYFSIFALGGVILSCITFGVTNPDHLYIIIFTASLVSCIPLPFVIVAPPKQLHQRGMMTSFFVALFEISKRNKTNLTIRELQEKGDINEIDFEVAKIYMTKRLTFKEKMQLLKVNMVMIVKGGHLFNTFGFFILGTATYIVYNAMGYSADDLGFSVTQVNVIILSVVEAGGYILCMFFGHKVKRRNIIILCSCIMILGGLLTIVFKNMIGGWEHSALAQTLVSALLIKGGLSVLYVIMYSYGAELFPSSLRGICMGLS